MVVEGRIPKAPTPEPSEDHSRDIYTVANIITVLRLMLIPIFFAVLVSGRSDMVAFLLFAAAASTDWLDGQIARRTGTVTEVGKAIDPLVDRLLIASGVLGVYLQGRLPIWIVVVLLARDAWLLFGASFLARRHLPRIPVVYSGKTATAVLLFGFALMILDWPQIAGARMVETRLLPGWGSAGAALGIWLVYAGVVISILTAVRYTALAVSRISEARDPESLQR